MHGDYIDLKHVKGRPIDTVKSKVFLKETEALVGLTRNNSQYLISCWEDARVSFRQSGKGPYSVVYMEEKLWEYLSEKIVIATLNNRKSYLI